MTKLGHLAPERVFYYFEQITAIPHGSGHTDKISRYCVQTAKALGLAARQESVGNVVIYKPASAGYEHHAPVILQGHLDMVCEKTTDSTFDFETDSLSVDTDGAFVWANGTTLGADDGIGVAMCLAIAEDTSLRHPPLEIVLTVDEETGVGGAIAMDPSLLTGKTLINIDSEEEGVLTVGCAGGAFADVKLSLLPTVTYSPCYKVTVSGLVGGHSGSEIGRGGYSANALLAEFLQTLSGDIYLSELYGGEKNNAICTYAECVFCSEAEVTAAAAEFLQTHQNPADPGLCVSVCPHPAPQIVYDGFSSRAAITWLASLPHGVQKMSESIPGAVNTSLNFGTLRLQNDTVTATFLLRSHSVAEREALIAKLSALTECHGGSIRTYGRYQPWEYKENSALQQTLCKVYEQLFDRAPKIEIIHAAVECGVFGEKIEGLDAVSLGPDIFDIHTVRERLDVASTERTYRYLCRVLEAL